MSSMFEPVTLGAVTLRNRIVMAPLTRSRAGDARVPNDLMVEYYRQRAGAGLILSEATSIMPMGVGYEATPGIWNAVIDPAGRTCQPAAPQARLCHAPRPDHRGDPQHRRGLSPGGRERAPRGL